MDEPAVSAPILSRDRETSLPRPPNNVGDVTPGSGSAWMVLRGENAFEKREGALQDDLGGGEGTAGLCAK